MWRQYWAELVCWVRGHAEMEGPFGFSWAYYYECPRCLGQWWHEKPIDGGGATERWEAYR